MKEIQFYRYKEHMEERRFRLINNIVETVNIKENKELISKYLNEVRLNGKKAETLRNRITPIIKLSLFINKRLEEVTKQDIVAFLEEKSKKGSGSVINSYKVALGQFYRWLYKTGKNEAPECVNWFELSNKNKTKKPIDILTKEEVLKLVEASNNPRDKAIIMLLADSGCRIGEICNLKIKDLIFDNFGILINVNGKTGERQVRLIDSVPYLKVWLNSHQFKNDKESPVFYGHMRGYIEPFGYGGVYFNLRRLAKLVGINKKVNPHIFRHSKLTWMSKQLTDAELRVYAGWVQGSNMANIYIHLNSNDVNNKILKNKGIDVAELKEEENNTLSPIQCPVCKNFNPADTKFCSFCNQLLDSKTAFNFNNNLMEENKNLNERVNIIENCLKQIVQTGSVVPFNLNNQEVLVSTSGLEVNKKFIKFNTH